MEDPKVYTVREFAKVMKISAGMAYKMARQGKLRTVRFGDRYLIPAKVISELLSNDQIKTENNAPLK
jgi:excisionase family DNA binding protein